MTVAELRDKLSEYGSDKEVVICLDGDALDISDVDFAEEEDWVTINS